MRDCAYVLLVCVLGVALRSGDIFPLTLGFSNFMWLEE